MIVEELKAILVESSGGVGLCNGETDGRGDTLTEGSGGQLDHRGTVASLRVARGLGVKLAECLEVVDRPGKAREYNPREEEEEEEVVRISNLGGHWMLIGHFSKSTRATNISYPNR